MDRSIKTIYERVYGGHAYGVKNVWYNFGFCNIYDLMRANKCFKKR